jgi:hypothetical protein
MRNSSFKKLRAKHSLNLNINNASVGHCEVEIRDMFVFDHHQSSLALSIVSQEDI